MFNEAVRKKYKEDNSSVSVEPINLCEIDFFKIIDDPPLISLDPNDISPNKKNKSPRKSKSPQKHGNNKLISIQNNFQDQNEKNSVLNKWDEDLSYSDVREEVETYLLNNYTQPVYKPRSKRHIKRGTSFDQNMDNTEYKAFQKTRFNSKGDFPSGNELSIDMLLAKSSMTNSKNGNTLKDMKFPSDSNVLEGSSKFTMKQRRTLRDINNLKPLNLYDFVDSKRMQIHFQMSKTLRDAKMVSLNQRVDIGELIKNNVQSATKNNMINGVKKVGKLNEVSNHIAENIKLNITANPRNSQMKIKQSIFKIENASEKNNEGSFNDSELYNEDNLISKFQSLLLVF